MGDDLGRHLTMLPSRGLRPAQFAPLSMRQSTHIYSNASRKVRIRQHPPVSPQHTSASAGGHAPTRTMCAAQPLRRHGYSMSTPADNWPPVLFPPPNRSSLFLPHKLAVGATEDGRRREPAHRPERVIRPLRVVVRAMELGSLKHTRRARRDSARRRVVKHTHTVRARKHARTSTPA